MRFLPRWIFLIDSLQELGGSGSSFYLSVSFKRMNTCICYLSTLWFQLKCKAVVSHHGEILSKRSLADNWLFVQGHLLETLPRIGGGGGRKRTRVNELIRDKIFVLTHGVPFPALWNLCDFIHGYPTSGTLGQSWKRLKDYLLSLTYWQGAKIDLGFEVNRNFRWYLPPQMGTPYLLVLTPIPAGF